MRTAQTTARITGKVTDASGAVVPGTAVTVINAEQQTSREVMTNEPAYYTAPNLEPGSYETRASRGGFPTFTSGRIPEYRDGAKEVRIRVSLATGKTRLPGWFLNRIESGVTHCVYYVGVNCLGPRPSVRGNSPVRPR